MIAEKIVMDMLRVVCGLEGGVSLEGVDLAAEAIAALKANLQ